MCSQIQKQIKCYIVGHSSILSKGHHNRIRFYIAQKNAPRRFHVNNDDAPQSQYEALSCHDIYISLRKTQIMFVNCRKKNNLTATTQEDKNQALKSKFASKVQCFSNNQRSFSVKFKARSHQSFDGEVKARRTSVLSLHTSSKYSQQISNFQCKVRPEYIKQKLSNQKKKFNCYYCVFRVVT